MSSNVPPGDVYTSATTADCTNPNCRTLDATINAFDTALAASTARIDRRQLALHTTRQAVAA